MRRVKVKETNAQSTGVVEGSRECAKLQCGKVFQECVTCVPTKQPTDPGEYANAIRAARDVGYAAGVRDCQADRDTAGWKPRALKAELQNTKWQHEWAGAVRDLEKAEAQAEEYRKETHRWKAALDEYRTRAERAEWKLESVRRAIEMRETVDTKEILAAMVEQPTDAGEKQLSPELKMLVDRVAKKREWKSRALKAEAMWKELKTSTEDRARRIDAYSSSLRTETEVGMREGFAQTIEAMREIEKPEEAKPCDG